MTGTVKVAHEDEISMPAGKRMGVDLSDWARVRRNVERLGESSFDRAMAIAATLIGAILALAGIIASIKTGTTKPASGLLTGLWVALALCALFAVIFLAMGAAEKRRYRVSNKAICEDMDDVADRLGHPGLGATPAKRKPGIKGRLRRLLFGDPPPEVDTQEWEIPHDT